MSVHNLVEKILKVDQLKNLKIQNLEVQEAFDNKIKSFFQQPGEPDDGRVSRECSLNINNLLLEIRAYSREQQRKLSQSTLLELNTNIKNELYSSINMYQSLINKITDCSSVSKINLSDIVPSS